MHNPSKPHTTPLESHDNVNGSRSSFMMWPFYFIMVLWVVFWLDSRYMLDLYRFGILPHKVQGLMGIVVSPFLHGSLTHLFNNTIPLLVLGGGLYYFYPRIASRVIIVSWIASGLIVWLIGRESYHIGASGLIYALAGFIFLCGILRRQPNLLALSLLVVFFYGSLVWGVLPIEDTVSWEAHLGGALSGFALAVRFRKSPPRSKKYSWEVEEEEDEIWPLESDAIEKDIQEHEAWEDYSGSQHGIRYIYKTNELQNHKDNE